MKYVEEYRDPAAARRLAEVIHRETTRPWQIMEVCGGQTHSIIRFGIDEMLPTEINLIHGPGCPVCVTPIEIIDKAVAVAARPEVIFCTFGDMMRVPGSREDLFRVKSAGGDVRVVYSPMDAITQAKKHPQRQVVFFAVGFEPLDILQGILMCVKQLETGRHEVENQYSRSVRAEGNPAAMARVEEVFEPVTRKWRGIGEIPASGLALREPYAEFDADRRFGTTEITADEPAECIAGEVLQGHKKPRECPAFGETCSPDYPLGAPMVSAEGACAAYYRYRRHETTRHGNE